MELIVTLAMQGLALWLLARERIPKMTAQQKRRRRKTIKSVTERLERTAFEQALKHETPCRVLNMQSLFPPMGGVKL